MDGLTGYKTAIAEQLPDARAVMDPFHVVKLASDALDGARRQVQQTRLAGLFADERNTAVEVTWRAYQKMIDAYQHPDKAHGRALMSALIDSIATGVPAGIQEIARLGRTLKRRSEDTPGLLRTTPAPPTDPPRPRAAGSSTYAASSKALCNPAHCTTRSLLEAGGSRPRLHPQT